MVSSSCKKLSRLELVYSVNYRLIKELNKYNKSLIPQECLVYMEKSNKSENYQLLVRMLQDQTTIDENNNLNPK